MDTNPAAQQISLRVAAAIAREERSKASVARATGIPEATFSRKINGHGEFTLSELLRIADFLRVQPSSLLPDVFVRAAA